MGKMICWIVTVLLFPLILLPSQAWAQDSGFTLDVLASTAKEVSLTVPLSGSIPVRIMQKGTPVTGAKVDLFLSEFIGEQGLSVGVKLAVDNTALPPATEQKGVSFPGVFLPIHLKVPPLPAPGKYSGNLALAIPDKGLKEMWSFKLTSAQEMRPATLVLDQGAATLNGVKAAWFGNGENPTVTVHVRDKTGFWMLDGVVARLEPGLTAPGHEFDMKRNLIVKFNDQPVDDIGVSPATGQRSVLPSQQAAMELQFKDLDVGAYTVPLRFVASNSGPDDQQRLTVTIQVKHWWLWAAIILVIAALFSFLGTQVATSMRRRSAFLERGRGMRSAWLAQERPVLPVIWFRAKTRQIEELSNRFWLTGQAGIDARLTQAAGMLSILERIHRLRERIEDELKEEQIKNRAIWLLDRIVSNIDADPSDQEIEHVKSELGGLELWLDPAKTDGCYWADLVSMVRKLLSEIEIGDIPSEGQPEAKGIIESLRMGIESPPNHDVMIGLEKSYQRLRIIWNHRGDNELFPKLLEVKPDAINRLFQVADGADWERLKAAAANHKLVAKGPSPDSLNPVEAYMPVTFRLEAIDDPYILATYLVQKKLTYTWKFEIHSWWFRPGDEKKKGELEVTSAEPKVTQYAPSAGRIVLKEVLIQYASRRETITLKGQQTNAKGAGDLWTVQVDKSSDFRIWRVAANADYIVLFLATIAGVVSGLMLYMQNPTFGSFKDYLQLFMWGAGIDQGKNFIQALGSWGSGKP